MRPGHPEKRERLARRGTFTVRLWTAIVTSHLGRRLLIKFGFYCDVKYSAEVTEHLAWRLR